jgi:hypothetical protein
MQLNNDQIQAVAEWLRNQKQYHRAELFIEDFTPKMEKTEEAYLEKYNNRAWHKQDWLLKMHRQGNETPQKTIERMRNEIPK